MDRDNPFCRLCWVNEQEEDNPLLSACKCRGGVQYIHYKCLKHWLSTKRFTFNTPTVKSYYWRQFECEICKQTFPYVFRVNGRNFHLVDVEVDKPDEDYLILESWTIE
mmetsp:Transcript_12107/g.8447  ORF Transcript_12107/g.8447 Transcript_12107/m.8447 type:complete len:108 (+) Transcript_12107:1383-1706(+)